MNIFLNINSHIIYHYHIYLIMLSASVFSITRKAEAEKIKSKKYEYMSKNYQKFTPKLSVRHPLWDVSNSSWQILARPIS